MRSRAAASSLVLCAMLSGAAGEAYGAGADDPWSPPAGDDRTELRRRAVRDDGRYARAEIGSYVVRSDVGPEFALDAALFLDRFQTLFLAVFEFRMPANERILCVIHADEREYRKAFDDGSRGHYDRASKTLYTYLARAKGETGWLDFDRSILLHEAAHQLFHAATGRRDPPVWLNEGVASFFQSWDVTRGARENLDRSTQKLFREKELRAAWQGEELVSLRTLVRLDWEAWIADRYGPRTTLHYAESAAFIACLLSSDAGKRTFRAIYKTFVDGGDPTEYVLDRATRFEREFFAFLDERLSGGE